MVVMSNQPARISQAEAFFGVKRTGLASLLLRLFRPKDAKAAAVNANALTLSFVSTSRVVPLGDIETADV